MMNYITFFAILCLGGILYAIYYKEYIFTPRMERLTVAKEFRYARSLNAELIRCLTQNATYLRQTGKMFNGLDYDATLDNLHALRDITYTTNRFRMLVGKKKTNPRFMYTLQTDVLDQIRLQQQLKDSFLRVIGYYNRQVA